MSSNVLVSFYKQSLGDFKTFLQKENIQLSGLEEVKLLLRDFKKKEAIELFGSLVPEDYHHALYKQTKLDVAIANADFDLAHKIVKELEQQLSNEDFNDIDELVTGLIYHSIGKFWRFKGDQERSRNYIQKAREIFEEHNYSYQLTNSISDIAITYRYEGKLDDAITLYNKGLEIAKTLNDHILLGAIKKNLSTCHQYLGNFSEAIGIITESLDHFRSVQNEYLMSISYNDLSIAYWRIGDLDNAEKYIRKSYEIKKIHGNSYDLSFVYTNLGNILYEKGELIDSLEYLEKAHKIYVTIGDSRSLGQSMHNIARVNFGLGNWEDAIEWSKESLIHKKKVGDDLHLGSSYQLLATVYYHYGAIEESIDYNFQAVAAYEKTNNQPLLAFAYAKLGEAYKAIHDYSKSLKSFKKALEIQESTENIDMYGVILYNLIHLTEGEECDRYYSKLLNLELNSEIIEFYKKLGQAEKTIKENPNEVKNLLIDFTYSQNLNYTEKIYVYFYILKTYLVNKEQIKDNLEEIFEILTTLKSEITKNNLIVLLIQLNLIEAQLHLLSDQNDRAMKKFNEVLFLTDKYRLLSMTQSIKEIIQKSQKFDINDPTSVDDTTTSIGEIITNSKNLVPSNWQFDHYN